jgi:hypothetical protein
MPKYNNRKVSVDNIQFDSVREANRYSELKLLQRAGQIRNLRLQVPFELIPTQYEPDSVVKGKLKRGKLIERSVVYKADFTYEERVGQNWAVVVEDVKGVKTKEYILKRKMMLQKYNIRIREV